MKSSVHTKNALLDVLFLNRDIIKSFGVKELGLFGSFLSDTQIHSKSDVDFLVDFEAGKKSYDNFINLSFFLEEITGRKIELLTTQSLSKYLGPYILNQIENVSL